jgi:hypothetical protein
MLVGILRAQLNKTNSQNKRVSFITKKKKETPS